MLPTEVAVGLHTGTRRLIGIAERMQYVAAFYARQGPPSEVTRLSIEALQSLEQTKEHLETLAANLEAHIRHDLERAEPSSGARH